MNDARMLRLCVAFVAGSAVVCGGCSPRDEAPSVDPHMAIGHHAQTLVKQPFEVDVEADGTMRLRRFGQSPLQGRWKALDERTIRFVPSSDGERPRYVVFWKQASLGGAVTFQVCETAQEAKTLLKKLSGFEK